MANYSSLANELSQIKNTLNTDYNNLNSLLTSIKGTFSGDSSTKLCRDLETSLESLKSQLAYIDNLKNTLNLLDKHSEQVTTLKNYQSQKNTWSSTDPEETNPYISQVASATKTVSATEKQITNTMPAISRYSTTISLITPNIDFSYKEYTNPASEILSQVEGLDISLSGSYQTLLDKAVNLWIDGFKNNKLNLSKSTLDKFYTADEVDSIIEQRTIGATAREKAVIAALTIIELGIDKNIRSKYQLSREFFKSESKPYNTEALITHGADCASYVSWALDTATSNDFNNASLKTIRKQGVKTNYEDLQPGDILYNDGHVAMVIDNGISNKSGSMIIADASSYETGGYPEGIRLQKISYKTLANTFTGYDFSNFYDQNA